MVKSSGSLIITTLASCIGVNLITGDQFIAILLSGGMLKVEYEKHGLAPVNLSRALEAPALLNTCGTYMANTLGVATVAYLPFTFFNLVCPLVSAAYAYYDFKLEKLETSEPQQALA